MCTALERSGVGKETSVVLAGVFSFSGMITVSFGIIMQKHNGQCMFKLGRKKRKN
ncbi:hypothetical protein GBL_2671 [Geobacillus kaustophilus GBlys]|uniref:Uncharacterized protein n=1 Tax=Geobacillus kaustophilus GBlys TaxID=1337888 RepID=U2Y536_GEOKU|nr:hypothetical protein GBL_2671 [Geobacillus kaustophilus GBlys]